jgi:hypothetical protein
VAHDEPVGAIRRGVAFLGPLETRKKIRGQLARFESCADVSGRIRRSVALRATSGRSRRSWPSSSSRSNGDEHRGATPHHVAEDWLALGVEHNELAVDHGSGQSISMASTRSG